MRIAFRTDASHRIGSGHVRRCLSLADALRRGGAEVRFVLRRAEGDMVAVVAAAGHEPVLLPQAHEALAANGPAHASWAAVSWERDASETCARIVGLRPDWTIVDHYSFDARWHDRVRSETGCAIAAIDDLADRPLSADLIVDHNWASDHRVKYAGVNLRDAPVLGGPRYALLNPAFAEAHPIEIRAEVRSIGVFMGGVDAVGATSTVLDGLDSLEAPLSVEVVATSEYPDLHALKRRCADRPGTRLLVDLPDLADFFSRHDLQVGAGGGATWERFRMGVPTIALIVAENQRPGIAALAANGCLIALDGAGVTPGRLANALKSLSDDSDLRRRLAARSAALVDGRGAVRTALYMLRGRLGVRGAEIGDVDLTHSWRNAPETRFVSRDHREIGRKEHAAWFAASLTRPDRLILIGSVGNIPVGVIRFDRHDERKFEISIYLDPGLRGLGLGTRLLLAGERAVLKWAGKAVTLIAETLEGNAASRALFEAAGYTGPGLRLEKRLK